ncbi:MAG: DNA translocase FtsK 4TM domain-containing protein [Deltaproteobacteria bacterium]|nr:DNA translocase FtsK 4TM domain-containing protein [Deltaproteobacteria bacterium]
MARAAAKRRRSASQSGPPISRRIAEECLGFALLGGSLLALLALATYSPADPIFERAEVANRAGVFGAAVAAILFRSLGYASAILVIAAGVVGVRLILGRGVPGPASRFWVSTVALLLSISTLSPILQQASPLPYSGNEGGFVGAFLAKHQTWLVGSWGAVIGNLVLAAIGILGATGVSAGAVLRGLGTALGWLGAGVGSVFLALIHGLKRGLAALRRGGAEMIGGLDRGSRSIRVWRERRARRRQAAAAADEFASADFEADASVEPPVKSITERVRGGKRSGAGPTIVDHIARRAVSEGVQEAFPFNESRSGPYQLPDISVFQRPPEGAHTYDRESLIMNSRILEKKLQDFGIGGRCVTVHPGPVITMYEFEPASGVKVNRIVTLADDLALALRALSVRIIAPLPGKSVVGIEVANPDRETVYLRDILESEALRAQKSMLTIALGKDIFGNPRHADLAKMPHLLVAGSTGTGKSVFLNSLLCSLLCRTTPDELKLLLVDPKLLELSVYGGIPHLIADVVTNPKRASAALGGVVRKMEERYQMMAALGVRSIAQFNERVDEEIAAGNKTFRLKPKPGEEEGEEYEYRRLPYIVVVIDELADLMVVSAREVEESLQRLAQMARAAGIHLVLATQRPSVDVLTGIIKANFPARISFQVSSRTDSRTILDQNGADHLLGQGDMLYLPPGTSKLERFHGAFVDEKEVESLTKQLRAQGGPQFDHELIQAAEESAAAEEQDPDVDEMFDRAVAIVADSRNASISYLQRRLKVGYNRAARMIEHMENEGIVGPQVGTKPREVFVNSIQP